MYWSYIIIQVAIMIFMACTHSGMNTITNGNHYAKLTSNALMNMGIAIRGSDSPYVGFKGQSAIGKSVSPSIYKFESVAVQCPTAVLASHVYISALASCSTLYAAMCWRVSPLLYHPLSRCPLSLPGFMYHAF